MFIDGNCADVIDEVNKEAMSDSATDMSRALLSEDGRIGDRMHINGYFNGDLDVQRSQTLMLLRDLRNVPVHSDRKTNHKRSRYAVVNGTR